MIESGTRRVEHVNRDEALALYLKACVPKETIAEIESAYSAGDVTAIDQLSADTELQNLLGEAIADVWFWGRTEVVQNDSLADFINNYRARRALSFKPLDDGLQQLFA